MEGREGERRELAVGNSELRSKDRGHLMGGEHLIGGMHSAQRCVEMGMPDVRLYRMPCLDDASH